MGVRSATLGAAVLVAFATGSAGAHAATVSSADGILRVEDAQGERNFIFVRSPVASEEERTQVRVSSEAGSLVAGGGCIETAAGSPYEHELDCTRGERMDVDARLGDGDDSFYLIAPYDMATLDGGPGNDELESGDRGRADFVGGAGFDIAGFGYYPATLGVTATIDDQPDDGAPGQGDNVHTDIEGLRGGSGDDRLYGTAARDVISGGSGDDLIVGADGDDSLTGDEGRDRVDGGPGNDRLDGAEWPHYQSPDTLDCGDGFDYLSLDEYDSQTGCENGSYPMGPGQGWSSQAPPGTRPPGWMPPLPPAQPLPVIAPKARLVRHAIRLGARCRADEPADCLGRIKLVRAGDHGGRVLGAGSFHLAPGRKATVKVGLTAYGVRAARAHRVLRATAVVTARGGSARRRSAVILRSAEAPARRR